MTLLMKVKGIEQTIAKMKEKELAVAKGTEMGLGVAGLYLQRESMRIVPVQTGNLRGSAFTRKAGSGFNTIVRVGYTAKYAIYVHERLDVAHGRAFNEKWKEKINDPNVEHTVRSGWFNRGPNQQAKFLEKPLREKRKKILDIIKKFAKAGLEAV